MTSPGGGVNEDAAGWSGDAFWVLDGATPLYGSYRKTAARWLVDTADRLLRRSLARGDPDDASTLLVSLARRLSTELRKANKTGGYGLPSAAVGIVLHRPEAVEYALLGDVTLVVADGSEIRVATDDRVGKLDAELTPA